MGNVQTQVLIVCGAKGSKKSPNSPNGVEGDTATMKEERDENESEEIDDGILVKNDQDKYFQKEDFEVLAKKYPDFKGWMNNSLLRSKVRQRQRRIKWKAGDMIGNGSFGRVIMGLNLQTGSIMAVKQVQIGASNLQAQQERIRSLEIEIELLSQLEHKSIVRYYGSHRTKTTFNIFLEYISGGTIASLVEKYGPLNENLIRVYTRQILEGLEYLHVRNIIHRDIKGANVLVDNSGVCKLADFGTAKRISSIVDGESKYLPSLRGTPNWMAPEVIRQSVLGRQSDIWSVGCTVLEMATGKVPWAHLANKNSSATSILYLIGSAKTHPPLPEDLSPDATDFLKQCFKIKPSERPNVIKLLNHKFITGGDNIEKPLSFPEKKRKSILNTLKVPDSTILKTPKDPNNRRSSGIYKFDYNGSPLDDPDKSKKEEKTSNNNSLKSSLVETENRKNTTSLKGSLVESDIKPEKEPQEKQQKEGQEQKENKIKPEELFKKSQLLSTPIQIDNKSYNFQLATKQDINEEDDGLRVTKNLSLPDSQPIRKYSGGLDSSQLEIDRHRQLTRYRKNSGNLRFTMENSPSIIQANETNQQIEASEIDNTTMRDNDNTLKANFSLSKRRSRRPLGTGKSDVFNNSRNAISRNEEEEVSSGASRKSSGDMQLAELVHANSNPNSRSIRRRSLFSDKDGANKLTVMIERDNTVNQEGPEEEKLITNDGDNTLKLSHHGYCSPDAHSKGSNKEITSPGSDSETSIFARFNYRTMDSNGRLGLTPDVSNISDTHGGLQTPENYRSNRRFYSLRQLPVRSIANTIKEVQMDHETQADGEGSNLGEKKDISSFGGLNLENSVDISQNGNEHVTKARSSPMNAEFYKERFLNKKGKPFRSMRQMGEQKHIKVIYEHREEDISREKETKRFDKNSDDDDNPVLIFKKSITDEKANSSDSGAAEGLEALKYYQEPNNKDTEDEEDKEDKGQRNVDIFINSNGWVKQSWITEKQGEKVTQEQEIECNYNENQDVVRL